MSRSGYYKWLRQKGKLNRYEREREYLKIMIMAIYDKHNVYGYRNIAKNIRNPTGWLFSDWLCRQCCKSLKIEFKARKNLFKKPGEEHDINPNLLNGNFTASSPLEKVCTDTQTFHHQGKTYDWNLYLDLFNTEIIAYDL